MNFLLLHHNVMVWVFTRERKRFDVDLNVVH